jgi:hypothetical protein
MNKKEMVEIALGDENLNKKQRMVAGRYFVDEPGGFEELVKCCGVSDQRGVNRRVGLFFDSYFREHRETKFANWE